jgi:hypothetical protein
MLASTNPVDARARHISAPLTARVCLPDTWDNEQAVVATNALLRQHPDVGVPYAMMVAYASAYPCARKAIPKTELVP